MDHTVKESITGFNKIPYYIRIPGADEAGKISIEWVDEKTGVAERINVCGSDIKTDNDKILASIRRAIRCA